MSQTGLASFDRTIQVTNVWLDDMMDRLGSSDRHKAYRALRVVLHALRDHLPVDEVVTFGAQLPVMVRGVYYEGWHPAGKPTKDRHKLVFLARIAEQFTDDLDASPEAICQAVFGMLGKQISAGEIEGVRKALPREIRDLWPA